MGKVNPSIGEKLNENFNQQHRKGIVKKGKKINHVVPKEFGHSGGGFKPLRESRGEVIKGTHTALDQNVYVNVKPVTYYDVGNNADPGNSSDGHLMITGQVNTPGKLDAQHLNGPIKKRDDGKFEDLDGKVMSVTSDPLVFMSDTTPSNPPASVSSGGGGGGGDEGKSHDRADDLEDAAGSSLPPGQSPTLCTVIGNYSLPGEEYDHNYEGVTELQRLLSKGRVQQILEQKHQLTPELVNLSCRRVSPHPASMTTLALAIIAHHNEDMVQLLLASGADMDQGQVWEDTGEHRSPLAVAATYNNLPVLSLLLASGAKCNNGCNALVDASDCGHEEAVRRLLEAGEDPNRPTVTGFTPLSRAANGGHVNIIRLLVQEGAKCNSGHGALHWACQQGHEAAVVELLVQGEEPDSLFKAWDKARTEERLWTPREVALSKGHSSIVGLLDAAIANKAAKKN